jgi:hypothetical protein
MRRRSLASLPLAALVFSLSMVSACAGGGPEESETGGAPPLPDSGDTSGAGDGGTSDTPAPSPTDPSEPPTAGDADGGPAPAPQEPLLSGSFAGSPAWNGQNLLWALVYRAPGASGHDHVVRSPDFSGNMTYRVGALSDCSVSVTVPVPTLINDETEMRARVGLADLTGDIGWSLGGGHTAVKNNMLAANQLDAAGFPTFSFQSTACRGTAVASGNLLVDGQLTLRGQTKPVTWALDLQVTGRTIRAKGTLRVRQTEYGITPYSFFGFANDDPVDLEFDIVVDG